MKRSFVIIAQPRTGTSMLVNTLNKFPNFYVLGEVFVWRGGKERKWFRDEETKIQYHRNHANNLRSWFIKKYNLKNPPHDIMPLLKQKGLDSHAKQYLDNYYNREGITGFKLLQPHINGIPSVIDYINHNNIYKIHLMRKNPLHQVISADWHTRNEIFKCNVNSVIKRARKNIEDQKKLFTWFDKGKYISFYYEDITGNSNITRLDEGLVKTLYKFLDLPLDNLPDGKVFFRKYGPPRISQRISNIKELEEKLKKDAPELVKWID